MMTYSIGDPFGRTREAAPRSIQGSIEIAAAPDVVFRALADPRELVAWLGDAPAGETPLTSPSGPSDDRASATRGGAGWLAHVRAPDGTPGTVSGEFLHVLPPRSLTTTWSASWHPFVRDEVTFELVPIDVAGVAGTRVTVTHRRRDVMLPHGATTASAGAVADVDGGAWPALLSRLAAFVAATNALSCCGITGEDDFTQAFGALHRRVVAIHQGDSA